MWQPDITVCEHCEKLVFSDITGGYDATTNPDGYGGGSNPASPSAFTSYTLKVWAQGVSTNGAPTYTLDLLANLPTQDANGHYNYDITLAQLGVDYIRSGIWNFEVTAVWNGSVIIVPMASFMVGHLDGIIDGEMLKVDLACACKEDCLSIVDMSSLWESVKSAACCGQAAWADKSAQWLYVNYKKCC